METVSGKKMKNLPVLVLPETINLFVGDKAFDLFVRHTNKDASEAPTLPHTLVG